MEQTTEGSAFIRECIVSGNLDTGAEYCFDYVKNHTADKEMLIFFVLFLIRKYELRFHEPQTFAISNDPDTLINHYHVLKFLIRRQEFARLAHAQPELYSYCREMQVSVSALQLITQFSTRNPESVFARIREELSKSAE